jgi:hypothetical protein
MRGHLIHVGFAKAGSTALGAWFEAHPAVAYAPNGLGGFYHAFDLAAAGARESDPPLWHVTSAEAFTSPRISDDPSVGAAGAPSRTGSLAESRERVCRLLRGLFPGATVLIVTRGFRAMAESAYSQYVKSGGPLSAAELYARGDHDPREYLDYDAVVELYENAFGADNVIVLPYELMRDEPATFTNVLESRLGLPGGAPPIPARNVALAPAALVWQRRLSVAVGAVARVLPGRAGRLLFGAYVALGRADRLRGPIELVERLVPGSRAEDLAVPTDVLEGLRGSAASLAGRPFYDRYAGDYLNDGSEADREKRDVQPASATAASRMRKGSTGVR